MNKLSAPNLNGCPQPYFPHHLPHPLHLPSPSRPLFPSHPPAPIHTPERYWDARWLSVPPAPGHRERPAARRRCLHTLSPGGEEGESQQLSIFCMGNSNACGGEGWEGSPLTAARSRYGRGQWGRFLTPGLTPDHTFRPVHTSTQLSTVTLTATSMPWYVPRYTTPKPPCPSSSSSSSPSKSATLKAGEGACMQCRGS